MKDESKKSSKLVEFMKSAFAAQDDFDEFDDFNDDEKEKASGKTDYQKKYNFDEIDFSSTSSSSSYASASSSTKTSSSFGSSMPSFENASTQTSTGNLYKMTSKPKFRLSILRLERLEDVVKVADNILSENTITLVDLRYVQKDVMRRIIDFIDGVRYTVKAKMETVADYTYVVVPKDVEMTGDLLSQIDTSDML